MGRDGNKCGAVERREQVWGGNKCGAVEGREEVWGGTGTSVGRDGNKCGGGTGAVGRTKAREKNAEN